MNLNKTLVLIGIQPPSFGLPHECKRDFPESRLLSVVGRRLYVYPRSPYCCPMLAKGYCFPDSKFDWEISVRSWCSLPTKARIRSGMLSNDLPGVLSCLKEPMSRNTTWGSESANTFTTNWGGGIVGFLEINGTTNSHSLFEPGRYTLRSMFYLVTAFCLVRAVAPKLTTPLVQSSSHSGW